MVPTFNEIDAKHEHVGILRLMKKRHAKLTCIALSREARQLLLNGTLQVTMQRWFSLRYSCILCVLITNAQLGRALKNNNYESVVPSVIPCGHWSMKARRTPRGELQWQTESMQDPSFLQLDDSTINLHEFLYKEKKNNNNNSTIIMFFSHQFIHL